MKVPNERLSGDGSAQTRRHEGHSWTVTPSSLLRPENFAVLLMKTKIFPT